MKCSKNHHLRVPSHLNPVARRKLGLQPRSSVQRETSVRDAAMPEPPSWPQLAAPAAASASSSAWGLTSSDGRREGGIDNVQLLVSGLAMAGVPCPQKTLVPSQVGSVQVEEASMSSMSGSVVASDPAAASSIPSWGPSRCSMGLVERERKMRDRIQMPPPPPHAPKRAKHEQAHVLERGEGIC